MIYKYAAGPDGDKSKAFSNAVVANFYRGGENVAGGALMGAVLGAECGYSKLPAKLLEGLSRKDRATLDAEVEAFLNTIPVLSSSL